MSYDREYKEPAFSTQNGDNEFLGGQDYNSGTSCCGRTPPKHTELLEVVSMSEPTLPCDDAWVSVEYAAGFIDADGCITCSTSSSNTEDWALVASQSEKNGVFPLMALKNRWGGSISKSKTKGKPLSKGSKYKANSDMYKWAVRGVEAAIAIQDIYHHLVIKREKAQLALEFFAQHPKISRILGRVGEPRP